MVPLRCRSCRCTTGRLVRLRRDPTGNAREPRLVRPGRTSPGQYDEATLNAGALIWTAVEEDIVLLVPSSASSLAWAHLEEGGHAVLEVLFGLPVTVADDLDARRAREVGQLLQGRGARIDLAHAAVCSQHRGGPLVTGEPEAYAALELPLEIESLP